MGLSKNDVTPSGGDIIKKVQNSKTNMLFFGGGVNKADRQKSGELKRDCVKC